MYIPREQIQNLERLLSPGKVVVIYGPRRVGKTTLLHKYLEGLSDRDVLFVNGDDIVARQSLESQSIDRLRDFVGQHSLLVIHEAQYIEKIGLNLKLIVDHVPGIQVIATGSDRKTRHRPASSRASEWRLESFVTLAKDEMILMIQSGLEFDVLGSSTVDLA